MNTPAHAILNLALLSRGDQRRYALPVFLGSVTPDLPMFGFYLWQKLAQRTPESVIWGEAYFRNSWQTFFDVFNSVPLAVAGLIIARLRGHVGTQLFFTSILLHCAFDLPLHHDDGHRHFLPLSTWRFESPVSYWDPNHHGAFAALFECCIVVGGSVTLWPETRSRFARGLLVLFSTLSVVGYTAFYVLR